MLTIVYQTFRRDCKIQWFLDSLRREVQGDWSGIRVVVVDYYKESREVWYCKCDDFVHVAPKPCVWQGPHRLTREDYFAASNARNTGLCYAPDGWIAYADDLSILMPGWLTRVREAMEGNYIALGAYKKVKEMVVEHGELKSCVEVESGIDSRWEHGSDDKAVTAAGSWMFGCSVAMPVEALLAVNGWPEDLCDGMGSEDYCTGIAMENNGYSFRYDRRMLTLESEEHHHIEKPLKRSDYGKSPHDKSHKALQIAMEAKSFTQSFGSIRELRQSILNGGSFPIPTEPSTEWFTGTPLKDLP